MLETFEACKPEIRISKSERSSKLEYQTPQISLHLPSQLHSQFEQFLDIGIGFGFGVNAQDRFCARAAEHQPGGILGDEFDAVVGPHMRQPGAKQFGWWIFLEKIHQGAAFFEREMGIDASVTMRTELFLQARDQ